MGVKSSIFILSEKEYEGALNLSCIKINFLKKEINLSKYDALIFSSKNGVLAIDKLTKSWKNIPSYSIGGATSKVINSLGGKVIYEAKSSYGDNFAKEIKDRLKGKKILFLRAKVVTSNLNEILLKAGVKLYELVVYETRCNDCKELKTPPLNSVIIFSSPSTIECFFRCFSWESSYKAVVIGSKTASFMPKDISFVLAPKQSINSCIELSKKLL